jgi:mono/diheme cytochrome c family protein
MKKLLRAVSIALAAAILAVPVHAQDNEDVVAKGRVLLELNCKRCHAITMEDSSGHEEAPPFRVVVTRYPPEALAEALAEGIVSGHPDMPEFVFQPAEIEAILAYLGTLAPAPEAAPDKN